MVLFSILELFDAIIMTLCLGFIFSRHLASFAPRPHQNAYSIMQRRFDWRAFYFSVLIFAPAIILHEIGHKFVAMAFGHQATFYSALSLNKLVAGLPFIDPPAILMVIALVSSYFGSPFFFFVPGYVVFSSLATPLQQLFIAFAGPGVNLFLWLGSAYLVKHKHLTHKQFVIFEASRRINMILFIFNMLPIPGFDGSKVFAGLFSLLS